VADASTPAIPFTFDISMGVRRRDEGRLATLNAFLHRRRPEIDRILVEYGVPRVESAGSAGRASRRSSADEANRTGTMARGGRR
jgi:hypothetical protein